MKKIVFAIVLAVSTAASAQMVDLPNLWWPKEFTEKGTEKATDVQVIASSKNISAYIKKEGLGAISSISKISGNRYAVETSECQVTVVVKNGEAYPVKNTLVCQ